MATTTERIYRIIVEDQFSQGFSSFEQKVSSSQRILEGFSTFVALQASRQIKEFAITSVQKLAAFEAAMAGVGRTTGLAGKDLEHLGRALRDLSYIELKGTQKAEDLAAIAETAGMLGIQGDKILVFTGAIAKMSVALDLSAEKTATAMAKIANQYNLNIENIQGVGDVINEVSQNTAATVNDLLNMVSRMAGQANLFGLTVDQVTALAGQMLDVGIRVERGATAMNTVFLKMMQDTDKFIEVLALDGEKFAKAIKENPQKAIEMLFEALGRIKEEQGKEVLAKVTKELVGGGNALNELMLKMAGTQDKIAATAELARKALEEGISVNKEFETVTSTQLSKWEGLKGKMDEVYRISGEFFKPLTDSSLDLMSRGLDVVIDGLKEIDRILGVITDGWHTLETVYHKIVPAAKEVNESLAQYTDAIKSGHEATYLFGDLAVGNSVFPDLVTWVGLSTSKVRELTMALQSNALAAQQSFSWMTGEGRTPFSAPAAANAPFTTGFYATMFNQFQRNLTSTPFIASTVPTGTPQQAVTVNFNGMNIVDEYSMENAVKKITEVQSKLGRRIIA